MSEKKLGRNEWIFFVFVAALAMLSAVYIGSDPNYNTYNTPYSVIEVDYGIANSGNYARYYVVNNETKLDYLQYDDWPNTSADKLIEERILTVQYIDLEGFVKVVTFRQYDGKNLTIKFTNDTGPMSLIITRTAIESPDIAPRLYVITQYRLIIPDPQMYAFLQQ